MLIDLFGRPITYLRISVTDRCNLRCLYCLPPEGIVHQPQDSILRYEEIAEVVRIAAAEGIRHVRLTGGEPLARLGLPDLVKMIAGIPGIEEISLTSNGILLEQYAHPLKLAGLTRINISLDTLRPKRFERITRGGSFQAAWRGILAAEQAGLTQIKINVVAMRGINDDEFLDMAGLTVDHPWEVRFIEIMPIKNQTTWGEGFPSPESTFISIAELQAALAGLQLEPQEDRNDNGPARVYRARGGLGKVGFISALSESFCQGCNRLRLTADGNLRPCLLNNVEIPLLPALRKGESILPLLRQAVNLKPAGHTLSDSSSSDQPPPSRSMIQIGG
jgi:GTP 3',8-cyclase